jgi:excisionase family DNA binding protein
MTQQTDSGRYLSRVAAAEYLGGLCVRTLDRLAAERRIPVVRVGSRVVFDVRDLDEFAAACKVPAGVA